MTLQYLQMPMPKDDIWNDKLSLRNFNKMLLIKYLIKSKFSYPINVA